MSETPENTPTQDYTEYSPRPPKSSTAGTTTGIIIAIVVLITVGGIGIVRGTLSKAPEYKPSETQMLRLQVKQSQAQTKKVLRDQAQAEFNAAYGALMDEANAIKKENKWPAETLVDPDKLQFSAPPKPTLPPAASPTAAAPPKK